MEYPGAIYHVMSRGDQRESVFVHEGDRHEFPKTLGDASAKSGFLAEST
jgi:putative transposase